jgi:hypothetical protein
MERQILEEELRQIELITSEPTVRKFQIYQLLCDLAITRLEQSLTHGGKYE